MKIVISAARRTPIGAFLGAFASVSATDLGVAATRAVLGDLAQEVEIADVVVGNVLQAGSGMNIARQIAIHAGLPQSTPGQTVNRVCGSGLQAVVTAAQALKAGDGSVYLAGGTENMSAAPYLLPKARAGLDAADIDMFELNEAFAAQSIAAMRDLHLAPEKVNPCGGAIALGHPIGASGARVLVTLIHGLRRFDKELGVASLCIGGGMGIAVVLRRVV